MRRLSTLLGILVASSAAGCSNPDHVLFVTNSSLGINFDTKPATASIAYDRSEGFVGPRFENGGAPPAVATMETDGNILNPMVRQTYATGAAAVGATSGEVPSDAPKGLAGEAEKRKLMFFGTSTTFGLKVGFAAAGANAGVPDSFLFGYRRKEVSLIPIAESKPEDATPENKKVNGVYPSVLASMEVNVKSSPTDGQGVGTTSKQFFSTGRAAEALSTNPTVRAAFVIKAENAALAGLSPEDAALAKTKATAFLKTNTDRYDAVVAFLTKDGPYTKEKLASLVKKANDSGARIPEKVKNYGSVDELKNGIGSTPLIIDALYKATQS